MPKVMTESTTELGLEPLSLTSVQALSVLLGCLHATNSFSGKIIELYLNTSTSVVGSGTPYLRLCLHFCDALFSLCMVMAHLIRNQEYRFSSWFL